MDSKVINGALFQTLLRAGFQNLAVHAQQINDLNVFPVPDGDTGTNMKMTMNGGLDALNPSDSIEETARDFARGTLFSARGNSGVLTSRYFKGLADGLLGLEEATVVSFAQAMVRGYETAYKAAETPAEGTILTVAREGIDNVIPNINPGETTFVSFFSMVVEAMRLSLDNTPNLLPILKESGVVDSGGKGLLTIFEGFLMALTGEKIGDGEARGLEHGSQLPKVDYSAFNENSVLDYGYCTEFLLQLLTAKIDVKSFDLQAFISFLQNHGNSIVCFQTGTIVKVHIHTKKPYEVIEFAQNFGEFITFKMENMALQHNEVLKKKEEKKKTQKPFGIIAIAQGDGFLDLFEQMGADLVLNGGQTMNTSTSEMIDAFNLLNTKEIVLLPDESNILMAAHQAAELYKGGKVYVLDTKTIPAGYAALSMLTGEEKNGQNCYETMEEGLSYVVSGFISQAIRDTKMNGVEVKKGEWIGGFDGDLVVSFPDRDEALLRLIEKAPDFANRESIVLFYGNEVKEEEAEAAKAKINAKYPQLEVGLISGQQAVYDYLLGII